MKKFYLITICLLFTIDFYAQTFNRQESLNLTVVNDTILYPFDGNIVTGIGISGHISYTSDLGFVRFVVNDNCGNEYMVYESYCLFEDTLSFGFSQKCEESCFYESYIPSQLKIQVYEAVVDVSCINLSNVNYNDAEYGRVLAMQNSINNKISALQNYITQNGLLWKAGHTDLSDLSYSSKTKLWGEGFGSYGYEYYAGGIYSHKGNDTPHNLYVDCYDFIDNFDWRNRHGANDDNSPYYDGDPSGSGWITPVVCQKGCWLNGAFECGYSEHSCENAGGEYRTAPSCWSFGPTANVEAIVNLYYNEHVDVDLSEQTILCRLKTDSIIHGGNAVWALNEYKNHGVPDENCLPYTASYDNCEELCGISNEMISITNHSTVNNSYQSVRRNLIQSGPLTACGIPYPWYYGLSSQTETHCMLLVGWGTIDKDTHANIFDVPANFDPQWYGVTYWIYKNSYGPNHANNGYEYIVQHKDVNIRNLHKVITPISSLSRTDADINCYDKDGDGYYNWGIGPKPSHCPPCPDEPDGDDNDNSLGPVITDNGQCKIINNHNASFEYGWDNWILSSESDFDWIRKNDSCSFETGSNYNFHLSGAQDGVFYLYADGWAGSNGIRKAIIETSVDYSSYCGGVLDFYNYQNSYYWGNETNIKTEVQISYNNGLTWEEDYYSVLGSLGDGWHHQQVAFPSNVNKIRIIGYSERNSMWVLALDNINISTWYHDSIPMIITNNELWEENLYINRDVIIENNAVLTIKNKEYFDPESKIIIKPGGHLILDGCKLTNACSDETWQGIEVWGNSSAHQYPVNGGYLQGYLEMKNGATIENAVCAVELCRPNYGNTTGGIIHASNAVFRNNAKSVHACYYSNYTPTNGAEVSYNSWFRNCTFTIDENYLGTETFYKHVDMEHVKGISFKGCDFSVLPNIDGVSSSCMGIGAYEAGFAVESYCDDIYNDPCPENSIIRSTFTGFNNGILSVNDGSNACAFSVKDAVFTNNNRGIYAQNTGFATILRNEFNIKSSGSICGYGVYAEGVTGFCIEENSFGPATNTRSHKYGVGIFNSRSVNDVYLNSFENLTCGNLAYGINHTADLNGRPPAIVFGLTYSCNDNTDNAIDFCVLKDIGSEGIGSMQGSASSPAGNTFGGNQYHFYNDGSYPVNYYYNANSSHEIPNTSKLFGVNTYSTTYNNSCASHYGGGSVSKSPEEKAALADAYKLADDAYNQLVEMYDSQIAAGITPKTELIAQIYQYAHDRDMAAGDIVRSDLNDSVANPTELRQWLGKMHDIAADRMAVASYMHEGDFKNALVLANSFPDVYSLKDDDLSDHNDYMKLLALYQTLYNSNRTVHEMTKEELVVVNSIAEYGLGTSRLMARAIMMEVSDRFVEPYICPELPGWNSRGENSNTDYSCEENDGFKVSVTPIPATTFVSVEYKLPDNTTKATMAITNVLGVKKIEMEVKGNQGVETIDISNLTPGIYILKVKTTDGKEYTERIVKD